MTRSLRRPTGVRAALLVAGAALALAACSSSGPARPAATAPLPTASLVPGACLSSGVALSDLHQRVGDMVSGRSQAVTEDDAVRKDQTTLIAAMPAAALTSVWQELVDQTGFLRAGVESNSYDATSLQRLAQAQQAVERACGVR